MRVLVVADNKILHDDSDPENILSGITAFQLACVEKVNGISRYGSVSIQMFSGEFGIEIPAVEVREIIRQYGG